MKYLIELKEWRLVRDLGRLFGQRKASYQVQQPSLHEPVFLAPAEHFEFELRQLLMYQDAPQNLDDGDFEECQTTLRNLCVVLDDLVADDWATGSPVVPAGSYPRLRALLPLLDSTAEPLDLIHGPNTTIFDLPHRENDLYRCLGEVTKGHRALRKLFTPPSVPEPSVHALRGRRHRSKDAWKKARIRKQATLALETLFQHFKCGTAHEVLLRLTEDTDQDSALPTLQMMLSKCPELESWLEARCESPHPYVIPRPVCLSSNARLTDSLQK